MMFKKSTLTVLLLCLVPGISGSVATEEKNEVVGGIHPNFPLTAAEHADLHQIPEDMTAAEEEEWVKTGKLRTRNLSTMDFFGPDDPYWNPNGMMERGGPCIPFDMIRPDQIDNPNAAGECTSNGCDGGCCRAYNWLMCDTDSMFAYVRCVCNDNTWPADQWTKAPTVPLPTSPTPPPTLAPVAPVAPPVGAPVAPPIGAPVAPPVGAPVAPPIAGGLGTIVDVVVADPRFTTLAALVTSAGLGDTLNGPGPYTIFAPTNEAFGKLPQELIDTIAADPVALSEVLLYHAVQGSVPSAALVDGATVTTVNGAVVDVSLNPTMINDANVIEADIPASNGIIHVLDTVLIPPTPARR